MQTNLVKLVTTTWAILQQYLGNSILLIKNIFCMFKCLTAGKYIRIRMYLFSQSAVFLTLFKRGMGSKRLFKGRVVQILGYIWHGFLKSMSILSNLRAVQSGSQSAKKIYQMFKKWMERVRGVSVNTHYFRLLFGRCSQNVVQVW